MNGASMSHHDSLPPLHFHFHWSTLPLLLFLYILKSEVGLVYIFIGAHALKVDHGAKSPEEAPFIERFQSLGPDLSKAEFKRLRTELRNFIKR
jgi:hypothetical protein